jgi:hypothetical protein
MSTNRRESDMKKRYQVFVSSTYEDLKEERFEVLKALLELDCIPCGMEYFPAASEDQWSYIRELIAECDYYIAIVAGRYGSTDEAGLSYTEKEYDYAVEQGIPTIGFIHRDPNGRPARFTENTDEGRRKLADFTRKVQRKLCKHWSTPDELGAVVGRSISHLIKRIPRTGWVRADAVEKEASSEIGDLKAKVAWLVTAVDRLRSLSDIPSLTSPPQPEKGEPSGIPAAADELSEDDLEFLAELDRAIHGGSVALVQPQPGGTNESVVAPSSSVDRTNTDLAFLEELDRAIAGEARLQSPSTAPPPAGDATGPAKRRRKHCKRCGFQNDPFARYCASCRSAL